MDYYLRCRQADIPQLYALAVALGVLVHHPEKIERTPIYETKTAPMPEGPWLEYLRSDFELPRPDDMPDWEHDGDGGFLLVLERTLTGHNERVTPEWYGIHPDRQGAWAVVGTIHRPTGAMLTTDMGEVPETAPVLDAEGQPYWHANLRIDIDLADRARELAPTVPAIAAGLADLARWFVVGPDGRAAQPKEPAQVWL